MKVSINPVYINKYRVKYFYTRPVAFKNNGNSDIEKALNFKGQFDKSREIANTAIRDKKCRKL